MQPGKIWVVDDDSAIRWVLERALSSAGYACVCFDSAENALAALNSGQPDVLISDIRMPGMDGLSLLAAVKQHNPLLPVIIMTAHSDLDAAVNAYQQGAFDYLPKPFDIDDAVTLVARALEHYREQHLPVRQEAAADPVSGIIGESAAMQEVYRVIGRLSRSSISVLINGESGTGKELVAHALHHHSPRADAPFIALNMAAIPKDLIESELFGHEKGAFTGASQVRRGRFEQADGGSLFLDEIGDMPLDLQPKLLRVLQEREIERIGGNKVIPVDVRLIAATNRNLKSMTDEREFREDLYYRLNVFPIWIPPLRERPEDIPLLATYFTQKIARRMNRNIDCIPRDALEQLSRYPWPGNVRELENVIERAVILTRGNTLNIQLHELNIPKHSRLKTALETPSSLEKRMQTAAPENDDEERDRIIAALKATNGVVAGARGAATRLGLKRTTLLSRMQRLGISVQDIFEEDNH